MRLKLKYQVGGGMTALRGQAYPYYSLILSEKSLHGVEGYLVRMQERYPEKSKSNSVKFLVLLKHPVTDPAGLYIPGELS